MGRSGLQADRTPACEEEKVRREAGERPEDCEGGVCVHSIPLLIPLPWVSATCEQFLRFGLCRVGLPPVPGSARAR